MKTTLVIIGLSLALLSYTAVQLVEVFAPIVSALGGVK